ncbi:MAG: helix-turn-helix domain-containing protein [Agarilytica sp.]
MASNEHVHMPTEKEIDLAKASSRTLSKYSFKDDVQFSIDKPAGKSDSFSLTGHTLRLFLDSLAEISRGNAVSILSHHHELSTQEAAEILNVSRPFFVKLLKDNEIPYKRVGSHRRIYLRDILTYKQDVDRRRLAVLDELTQHSQRHQMGY